MKITLEFEHPHELIDLLKSLSSSLKVYESACAVSPSDIHTLLRKDAEKHSKTRAPAAGYCPSA